MRILVAVFATATGAFAYATAGQSASVKNHGPFTPRTTWDSVYSGPQAARGDAAYHQSCAKCHGVALAGTDSAAELAGKSFLGNWDGLTLDQLSDKIRTSMPPDNPNSIAKSQVADIVAYILAKNQYPAGKGDLSPDSLTTIVLVKSQP